MSNYKWPNYRLQSCLSTENWSTNHMTFQVTNNSPQVGCEERVAACGAALRQTLQEQRQEARCCQQKTVFF